MTGLGWLVVVTFTREVAGVNELWRKVMLNEAQLRVVSRAVVDHSSGFLSM